MKRLFWFLMIFYPVGIWSQNAVKHEMRAVWVATVENIDWPSSDTLSVEIQQKELTDLLDRVKALHMNTIVFQIRPAADALYASSIEPWSVWLTGKQGKVPFPFYDPLEFAIRECHRRGLYIHVWLNPYRAIKDTGRYKACTGHITRTHPEWFLLYGNTLYFNPGLQETRDYVSHIVGDVVRRYDIDAIHMDDYFYPYRIPKVEFPDAQTFARYPRGFSSNALDDWRRDNVDLIIHQIHDSIRAIKPWVEFGISPFGVWRNASRDPSGSATQAGQTNYDDLYADILKWEKERWIDYVVPQVYWQIGKKNVDYTVLTDWWSQHAYGCQVYIGQAPYRIEKNSREKSWRSSREIIRQVQWNRQINDIKGSMFFSAKVFGKNPDHLNRRLLRYCFPYQALVPQNPNIGSLIVPSPEGVEMKISGDRLLFRWKQDPNIRNYVIYKYRKGENIPITDPSRIFCIQKDTSLEIRLTRKTNPKRFDYVITSLSMTHQESQPVIFKNISNALEGSD